MKQIKIPAVFMRGGTSKAIVFKQQDLPADRALWPEIFLAAQGSPDPFGRQLNGMGGGISSLSKICVIGPPSRNDADIDYTFAQVGVRDSSVGFASNCGNMSSAMAPFAVDEGLVKMEGTKATVRIHNTNTNKIIVSHFDMDEGFAAVDGEYVMSGVAEPGAKVRLDFLDPGGAITGWMLPRSDSRAPNCRSKWTPRPRLWTSSKRCAAKPATAPASPILPRPWPGSPPRSRPASSAGRGTRRP
jgi:2-methylaconitate cis-trans-isomerase PrpF